MSVDRKDNGLAIYNLYLRRQRLVAACCEHLHITPIKNIGPIIAAVYACLSAFRENRRAKRDGQEHKHNIIIKRWTSHVSELLQSGGD